jgi:hypothetical protein
VQARPGAGSRSFPHRALDGEADGEIRLTYREASSLIEDAVRNYGSHG